MANRRRRTKWKKQNIQDLNPTPFVEPDPEPIDENLKLIEEADPEEPVERKPKKLSYRNRAPKKNPFISQTSIKRYHAPRMR